MTTYLTIPGLGNSGADHWQTHWEKSSSNFTRIEQEEWDAPNCAQWIKNIETKVSEYDLSTVVLIAHSLGCMAVAHWATTYNRLIKGAMLVAPSDAVSPLYTFPSTGFDTIPTNKINFKTILVTSSNDPWVSLERATLFANNWGSTLVNIGNAGHISTSDGYGNWEEGLELLKQFQ